MKNVRNYIDGAWCESKATEFVNVINPATQELMTKTPLAPAFEVDAQRRLPPGRCQSGGAHRLPRESNTSLS
jgi:acyl-CoA reductase-like NAD-dependent aldehyde dehydrogenase